MASSASIILVRLQSSHSFDEAMRKNLDKLVKVYKADVITENPDFQVLFKQRRPKAIILADNVLALPEHADARQQLYGYIKAGGTVILAFRFAVMCTESNLDTMFEDLGIPMWTHASSSLFEFTRTNFRLHPVMKETFGAKPYGAMTESYPIKAVHIEGVEDRDKVYIPGTLGSVMISSIKGHDSACTAAFTRIAAGYLGYIGDFPLEYGTVKIIKAMIDKALGNQKSGPSHSSIHTHKSKGLGHSSANTELRADLERSLATPINKSGPSNAETRQAKPSKQPTETAKRKITPAEDDNDEEFGFPEGLEDAELVDDFENMWLS